MFIVGRTGQKWDICVSAYDADEAIDKAKRAGYKRVNCSNEVGGLVATDLILK